MPTQKRFTEEEARERKNARQREYARKTGYASNAKYNADKTKMIGIRFVLSTEQDLLDYLETKENKSGYVKNLIRADMSKAASNNKEK